MVTTRTPIRRRNGGGITPEAIDAYRIARKLYDHPKSDIWEEQGGCKRAYYDACNHLHTALGRKPWQATVFSTIGADELPGWVVKMGSFRVKDWERARDIRIELERLTEKDDA
jgi:hypothetical protein